MNRPDGYPGLIRAYGLEFAQPPREMDRNLLYQALAQDSLDLAAGDSTDGRIAAFDLVQLDDDRRYFPPYQAVPLVRAETLDRFPQLRDVLNRLAGKIDARGHAADEPRGRRAEAETGGGREELPPPPGIAAGIMKGNGPSISLRPSLFTKHHFGSNVNDLARDVAVRSTELGLAIVG